MKRFLVPLVGALASSLGVALRLARALGAAPLRLGRLASLRSRVDGTVPVTTQFDGPVRSSGRVRLELGEHCRLGRDLFLETCEGGVIRIGAHSRINTGCFIVSYAEITIGRDCLIGEYVGVRDADHGLAVDRPIREQPHSGRPIRIGDGAWIGRGAVLLKGVTIGPGAIVAANSVVTRDVAALAIVAGAPARLIRSRGQGTP